MRKLAFLMMGFVFSVVGLALLLEPYLKREAIPNTRSYGQADIGGAFEAVNHHGQPVTEQVLQGQYSLVYFGFTYCPDICPTGLLKLSNALEALPESVQSRLLPVFVTVDPNRDTPEVMARYVQHFHPRLLGVTGTPEQIDALARAYKVYYQVEKPQEPDQDYVVDHSSFFYLMDPQGNYLAHYPHSISEQKLADSLRAAVK